LVHVRTDLRDGTGHLAVDLWQRDANGVAVFRPSPRGSIASVVGATAMAGSPMDIAGGIAIDNVSLSGWARRHVDEDDPADGAIQQESVALTGGLQVSWAPTMPTRQRRSRPQAAVHHHAVPGG
jgi:hypothetical protein